MCTFASSVRLIGFVSSLLICTFVQASTYVVLSAADDGAGTLREAIGLASARYTVIFSNSLNGDTILLTGTVLNITRHLVILGNGPDSTIIDGNNNNSIFRITQNDSLELRNLRLQNGRSDRGGGILNDGIVAVIDCEVRANTAVQASVGQGGGIFNSAFGTMLIAGSTISANRALAVFAGARGGGIYNAGELIIIRSTISGNRVNSTMAPARGGGLYNGIDATVSITSSTIARNVIDFTTLGAQGGGLYNSAGGDIEIHNTILALNTAFTNGRDAFNDGSIQSSGYNLVGDSTDMKVSPAVGDTMGQRFALLNPLIGPLQDNGGPTRTHALLCGSPCYDNGDPALFGQEDQRGLPPFGSGRDIGAYESQFALVGGGNTYTVTSTSDGGLQTLRFYVGITCPGDTIEFDPATNGDTIRLQNQITLNNDMVIEGNGPAHTILDGQSNDRIFQISSGANVHISGVKIQNGKSTFGGGIFNSGTLLLSNSEVCDNTATGPDAFAFGGGIASFGGLTLRKSTVCRNNATAASPTVSAYGGGIIGFGPMSITRSTISGNICEGYNGLGSFAYGGGIAYLFGNIDISYSTITDNRAIDDNDGRGGGIYNNTGSLLTFHNSVLAGNSANTDGPDGADAGTVITSNGYNFVGDTSGFSYSLMTGDSVGSSLLVADPLLAPLGCYGGPTRTHALLCSSPLYNEGDPSSIETTDQRGLPFLGVPDIGAFESQGLLADADGDGYCGYDATNSGMADCDEGDPAIHPGAIEICGNGVDEDCSGIADLTDADGYCCSLGNGDTHYIDRVHSGLNGLDNSSGDNGGYGDYTDQIFTVNPYLPYLHFTLTHGGQEGMKHWQVYADWNRDSIFSVSENLVDYCTAIPLTRIIPLPAWFSGDTRIRVIMTPVASGCDPDDIPTGTCGEIGGGEVEDYTVERNVLIQSQVQSQLQLQGCQVTVFPNPTTDLLYLTVTNPPEGSEWPGSGELEVEVEVEVEVVNTTGRTVLQKTETCNSSPLRINVSHLPPGTYFLRVNTGEEVMVSTVVKQ